MLSNMTHFFPRGATRSTFSCLEFREGKFTNPHATNVEQLLGRIQAVKSGSGEGISGLCVLFEDISPEMAAQIDHLFNIGLEFFHNHLAANKFPQLGSQLKRSTVSLLSSQNDPQKSVHLYYKRILQAEQHLSPIPYNPRVEGNAERYAGQMPRMKECCVSIADACFSIMRKEMSPELWICKPHLLFQT
jgi:hypothetical protein